MATEQTTEPSNLVLQALLRDQRVGPQGGRAPQVGGPGRGPVHRRAGRLPLCPGSKESRGSSTAGEGTPISISRSRRRRFRRLPRSQTPTVGELGILFFQHIVASDPQSKIRVKLHSGPLEAHHAGVAGGDGVGRSQGVRVDGRQGPQGTLSPSPAHWAGSGRLKRMARAKCPCYRSTRSPPQTPRKTLLPLTRTMSG